ncbi:MAG: hypothetical protein QOE70_1079 [Chthoniobacter sp.]|jgi:hypothetical protein|nr:hypothetical protein [Chthoniobacter sp.]
MMSAGGGEHRRAGDLHRRLASADRGDGAVESGEDEGSAIILNPAMEMTTEDVENAEDTEQE